MRKLTLLLLALLVLGTADSIYLVSVELHAAPLVCSSSGIIDCAKVLSPTDPYSIIFGVPLAFYALAWFIISAIIFATGKKKLTPWYLTGLIGVIYSIVAMSIIRNICIYCSILDATLIAIAAVAFFMMS
ncbi:Vitamin K epoxide reductase [mine drainage metagenome]|uniref:Vitamin K epoxide reductase n=1 Tax=mine drainage metagenome TaxID=410659 RepID=T0ZKU0_9ZZZZ